MSLNNFTVTQVIYNFTATQNFPVTLTLNETPSAIRVYNTTTAVAVNNTIQPVTVIAGGGGGGATYNQSLNTTDNVSFASVTTPSIYGVGQTPVNFPSGVNLGSAGIGFQSSQISFGKIGTTITNQLELIYAFLPVDFGSISNPVQISIQF